MDIAIPIFDGLTALDAVGPYPRGALPGDEAMLSWVREAHAHSQWTTSVCTGALVLGAPGS